MRGRRRGPDIEGDSASSAHVTKTSPRRLGRTRARARAHTHTHTHTHCLVGVEDYGPVPVVAGHGVERKPVDGRLHRHLRVRVSCVGASERASERCERAPFLLPPLSLLAAARSKATRPTLNPLNPLNQSPLETCYNPTFNPTFEPCCKTGIKSPLSNVAFNPALNSALTSH